MISGKVTWSCPVLSEALIVLVQDQMICIICKREGTFPNGLGGGRMLLHVTISDGLHEDIQTGMNSHMEERKKKFGLSHFFKSCIVDWCAKISAPPVEKTLDKLPTSNWLAGSGRHEVCEPQLGQVTDFMDVLWQRLRSSHCFSAPLKVRKRTGKNKTRNNEAREQDDFFSYL